MARVRQYETNTNGDYSAKYDKAMADGFTPLQSFFGEWAVDVTGATFKTTAAEAAFKAGVSTALMLRTAFQQSQACHDFIAERKEASEAEAAEKAQAREDAKAERDAKRAAAKEEADAKRAAAKEAKAAKTTATKRPATKAKATKGAATNRPARRPAASGAVKRPTRKEADF